MRIAIHPALKDNESALLESLLACTDYGILITHLTSRQDVLCNARFGELFGMELEEIVLCSPDQVRQRVFPRLKDPEGFQEDLAYVFSHPDLERADELELVFPDQTLHRHTAPLKGADGDYLGRVWTFLDITAMKRLQQEVERHSQHLEQLVEERTRALFQMQQQIFINEKMRTLGDMASAVAYDLRNILTPLKIELGTLSMENDSQEIFNQSIQRLLALSHQLLSVSRPPRLEVSRTDLRDVWCRIEPLIKALAEKDSCLLDLRLPEEPIPVEVNTDQIEQVFVHLVINAFNALSSSGGTLTVRMALENDQAVCDFIDTGPGIPSSLNTSLFDPFVSGRQGGTGLGLYNCRRIAQDHGGNVTLENSDAGCTRFCLRLPATRLTPTGRQEAAGHGRESERL